MLPEVTDFLWFLSGLLDLGPWAVFEKLNNVINKFAGSIYGIPDWRRRGYVCVCVFIEIINMYF